MTPATRKPTSKLNVKARMLQAGWGEVSNGPRWLLPATPAAYDAMVEQMVDAWDRQLGFPVRNPNGRHIRILRVQAMLAAIGIKEPKA